MSELAIAESVATVAPEVHFLEIQPAGAESAVQHSIEHYGEHTLDHPVLLAPLDSEFTKAEKAARNHARIDAFADIRRTFQNCPAVAQALRTFELAPEDRDYIRPSSPLRQLRNFAGRYRRLDDEEVYPLFKTMEDGLEVYASLDSISDANEEERLALTKVAAASTILYHSNLRLSIDKVRKKYGRVYDGNPFLEDIAMAGIDGMDRAVQLFDYRKDYKFSTFAVPVLERHITRYVTDNARNLRLPVPIDEKAKKVSVTSNKLAGELNRDPSLGEIAAATKMSELDVQELIVLGQNDANSLDSGFGAVGNFKLSDVTADPMATGAAQRTAEQNELNDALGKTLNDGTLTTAEKLIISLRFGIYDESLDDESLREINPDVSYDSLFEEAAGTNGEGMKYRLIGEALGKVAAQKVVIMETEALAKLAASEGLQAFANSLESDDAF